MSKEDRSHSKKSTDVEILGSKASVDDVYLNTKKKEWVTWTGVDEAYELWFRDSQWAFGTPDKVSTGYKIIVVPHGHKTKKWSLDYELPPGSKPREHKYSIHLAASAGAGGPPEGPSVWGEG